MRGKPIGSKDRNPRKTRKLDKQTSTSFQKNWNDHLRDFFKG